MYPSVCATSQSLYLIFHSHQDVPASCGSLYSQQRWKHTYAAGAALHTRSFISLTLLLLSLGLLFLALAVAPALVKLPLWEHLPGCTRQDRHYINKEEKKRIKRNPNWNHADHTKREWEDENSMSLLSYCRCRATGKKRITDTYFVNENTNSILKDILQHSILGFHCNFLCNFMRQWCLRVILVLVPHPPLLWSSLGL